MNMMMVLLLLVMQNMMMAITPAVMIVDGDYDDGDIADDVVEYDDCVCDDDST